MDEFSSLNKEYLFPLTMWVRFSARFIIFLEKRFGEPPRFTREEILIYEKNRILLRDLK